MTAVATLFRSTSQSGKWIGPERATEQEALEDGRRNRIALWPSFLQRLQVFRDGAWQFAGHWTTREIFLTFVDSDGSEHTEPEASFCAHLQERLIRVQYWRRSTTWPYHEPPAFIYQLDRLTGADCYGVNAATYRAIEEVKRERFICPCCHQFKEETWFDVEKRLGIASS